MKLIGWFALLGAIGAGLIGTIWQATAFGVGDMATWMGLGNFAKLATNPSIMDTSNDDACYLSSHQLIERAGFKYENHLSMADDGYVTQLIRIVNPLADRSQLKWPPIMLQHGQTSNSKNFIIQSNKQHHPMRWPPSSSSSKQPPEQQQQQQQQERQQRNQHDLNLTNLNIDNLLSLGSPQPVASSNRSLAFMLANNGYDVWLTSTRGVDENNRGHKGSRAIRTYERGGIDHKNMTKAESRLLLNRIKRNYWSFTLDDQIAQELPAQIATVLNATGSSKVTVFGFSNTALTTMAMLTIRQDISPFVDTFIAAAPVVFYNQLDGWFRWFMDGFMQLFPKNFDAELFITEQWADFIRRSTIMTCGPLPVRYTWCKFMLNLFFGDSGQFTTNLELPFFAHLLRPTSWKCLAQHLQIVRSRKLAKFDYGPLLNRHYYGQWQPPEYDITRLSSRVKVVLVSGAKDCWANQATLDELRAKLPTPPALDLVVDNYNHLDIAAAFDVDEKVNLPLLRWLDERHAYLKARKLKGLPMEDEEEPEAEFQDADGSGGWSGRQQPHEPMDLLDPFALLNIEPPSLPFHL